MSTVVIGCKLPSGIWMIVGECRLRINGWNNNTIKGLKHGITAEVPESLWDAWRKEHAGSRLVKDGFIFAEDTDKRAIDKAKDEKEQKSGYEQMPQIKETDKADVLGASEDHAKRTTK